MGINPNHRTRRKSNHKHTAQTQRRLFSGSIKRKDSQSISRSWSEPYQSRVRYRRSYDHIPNGILGSTIPMRSMKKIFESFEKSLIKADNNEIPNLSNEEKICLDKESFNRLIDMLHDEFVEYRQQTLKEGGTCLPFEKWLKIQNAWTAANKGSLNKV